MRDMWLLRLRNTACRGDERGFTLPEVLTVIAIIGILVAIAVIIWLRILEQRRVDAATNQLVADLRFAHTSATNQLTDWRVVLFPERADESAGPDYYMVKLTAPYPAASPPVVLESTSRTFPGNVKVMNIAGSLDTGAGGWATAPSVVGQTRTLEFNTDGAMKFYGAVSGSTCVTVDTDPENRITVLAATSRVKVKADAC
jgi:prepilin-type N-terminal cleavage/methylation domain-containing protein